MKIINNPIVYRWEIYKSFNLVYLELNEFVCADFLSNIFKLSSN